ncbi:MAG: hypothetical protein OXC07_10865, partial [Kistimonas sp.]|nr:hypothetical protein [Kistimonas sp.]
MRTNPALALTEADALWKHSNEHPHLRARIAELKARALFQLSQIDACISFINSLESATKNDKGLLIAKGRALQAKGQSSEALAIFQHLYANYRALEKDHKTLGLALGRHLQLMGGTANMNKALAIFAGLRSRMAGGLANTACDDKEVELALARHFQLMGGPDNLNKALAIYTGLRTRMAGGHANRPCDDKSIELSLGRHLQLMGGTDNMKKA